MAPDLEKLRRFALAVGLILIAYVVAGVNLEAGAKVSVLGLPFVIRRPELLPASLMLASIYGLLRFYYYGFMLGYSPHRRRKDVLHKLHAEAPGSRGNYKGSVFFGPELYSTTPLISDRAAVYIHLQEIIDAFPKIGSVRSTGIVERYVLTNEDGEEDISYGAKVTIPFICRVSAFLQDLDYSVPIWLNTVALALAAAWVLQR